MSHGTWNETSGWGRKSFFLFLSIFLFLSASHLATGVGLKQIIRGGFIEQINKTAINLCLEPPCEHPHYKILKEPEFGQINYFLSFQPRNNDHFSVKKKNLISPLHLGSLIFPPKVAAHIYREIGFK